MKDMSKPPIRIWILTLAGLLILVPAVLQSRRGAPNPVAGQTPDSRRSDPRASGPVAPLRGGSIPEREMETSEEPVPDADRPVLLPREKVEEYLARNHRDAASLLAAFHALTDTNYLHEAAARFPADPQVQWTVLARNAYPEDRRKWLDLFKTSSPENSLANYLSAADYFKTSQPNLAVQELLAASGKKTFKDYILEARLNEEELGRSTGSSSPEQPPSAGWAADLLPELSTLKGLARAIGDTRKQYLDTNDAVSANDLVQMQLLLAGRLSTGDGGKLIINQLVGQAIESLTLKQLEPNTTYDFLAGHTPTTRLEEVKARNKFLRETISELSTASANLNEAERASFADRVKVYGEVEAARWLRERSRSTLVAPNP